jgi:hypothetical protein
MNVDGADVNSLLELLPGTVKVPVQNLLEKSWKRQRM